MKFTPFLLTLCITSNIRCLEPDDVPVPMEIEGDELPTEIPALEPEDNSDTSDDEDVVTYHSHEEELED